MTVGMPLHHFGGDGIIETAAVGDTVMFEFYPPRHSVVQATEGDPCIPYENSNSGKQGFFSGMMEVGTKDEHPLYRIRINDTKPIFFYCSALGSCVEWKMVGGINMNRSTLDRQRALINKNTIMLQPGEATPSEGTATGEPHDHAVLSTGAIVGIAVGGTAVLALAAALFFFVGRTKTLQEFALRRGETRHSSVTYKPGFEGCMPVKGDDRTVPQPGSPPAYNHEYGVHPAHLSMASESYMRDPAMDSRHARVDAWRMSAYNGPPQEMEGEGVGDTGDEQQLGRTAQRLCGPLPSSRWYREVT